jgi:GNAT superfamily N-acetyltransferase
VSVATTGAGLTLRPARPDDAPALAALCAQLGYRLDAASVQTRLRALEADASQAIEVAERDGQVLGWIQVAATNALQYGPVAEILGLVVDAAARGDGIGAALVARAEAWARARALAELRVRSRDTREDAHRFYRRAGFSEWKRQLVLRKPLLD